MPNPIFNMLNRQKAPQMSLMDNLRALQSNPTKFLMQRSLNVPNGITDPQQIVQHWLNNGTMSQEQFNQLQNQVNQLMNTSGKAS